MVPPGMWTDPGNLSAVFNWTTGTISYTDQTTGNPVTGVPIFYIVDAWMDPTQLNTIFKGGFTGELPGDYGVPFPTGNYMCGRCHLTGYQFDSSGPEPTDYKGNRISDADFGRIPSDFLAMPGPVGIANCTDPTGTHCTSSWYLDAIQCERCHVDIVNQAGGHNCYIGGVYNPTYTTYAACTAAGGAYTVNKPTNDAATKVCIECHRQETYDTVGNAINLTTSLAISGFACSDGVSTTQAACLAGGGAWMLEATALDGAGQFFDTNPGQTFLNSPHARFTGTLAQNVQNSADLSVVVTGTYSSKFGSPNQGGCTTCHDVHQSVVKAVGAATPVKATCDSCHTGNGDPNAAQVVTTNHPTGSGTPAECSNCHMPSGTTGSYHLMRINIDPNYSTFPNATQYAAGQTYPNTAPDGTFAGAVWIDIDLACGQCHGGDNNTALQTNSTLSVNGAPYLNKKTLAGYAARMHIGAPAPGTVSKKPTASNSVSQSGWAVYVKDSSTTNPPTDGCSATVTWGDGASTTQACGTTFTKTYQTLGTWAVIETVTDTTNTLSRSAAPAEVTVPLTYTVSGKVVDTDGKTTIPLTQIYLYGANGETYAAMTASDGAFSITKVNYDTYTMHVVKSTYTFPLSKVNVTGPTNVGTIQAQ
jgi:hypothetical protein